MNPSPNYSWLLFDADGTLFDYDRAEEKALQGAFQDFDLSFGPQWAESYRAINQQIWLDFEAGRVTSVQLRTLRFERLFEAYPAALSTPPPAADRFSQRYLYHLSQGSDLMPGAAQVIRTLRKTHHLALITNGLKDVQRPRLALSEIADAFEIVAISEEIGAAKPDERFFECVFAQMNQPARAEALVIGDSLSSDIQGGNRYQLHTCWFNPLRKPAHADIPATYQIHDLTDLLHLPGIFIE